MNSHDSNPVGRLYLVLNFFTTKSDAIANQTVLAEYLHLAPQASPAFYAGVAALLNLPGEARAAFGRSGTNAVPFEETLAEIDRGGDALFAAMALGNSCKDVKDQFDRGTLVGLSFASRAVGSVESAPPLDDAERDAIRTAATDLIDAVRVDGTLPPDAKRILIDHAEAVLSALNLVNISGVDALLRERDRLSGRIRRQPTSFIEVFRAHKVGAALVAFNLALSAVGGAASQLLVLESLVEKAYELVVPDPVHPTVQKQIEAPNRSDPE